MPFIIDSEESMIYLTRLNGESFVLNSELIETIDKSHDTVVCLTTGKRIIVKESPEEIIESVLSFRKGLLNKTIPVIENKDINE